MPSADLAFYTCDELIGELMRRKTFYGCVVRAAEDHKDENWNERVFRLHFNDNLGQAATGRLLESVVEYLNVHLY